MRRIVSTHMRSSLIMRSSIIFRSYPPPTPLIYPCVCCHLCMFPFLPWLHTCSTAISACSASCHPCLTSSSPSLHFSLRYRVPDFKSPAVPALPLSRSPSPPSPLVPSKMDHPHFPRSLSPHAFARPSLLPSPLSISLPCHEGAAPPPSPAMTHYGRRRRPPAGKLARQRPSPPPPRHALPVRRVRLRRRFAWFRTRVRASDSVRAYVRT